MLCKAHETGQGLVEYAFILLLVAMIVFVVLLVFGPVIGNVFTKLNSSLKSY
jgi:pilus assembly protein Flp/PilA